MALALSLGGCARDNSDSGIANDQAATGARWPTFPVQIQADARLLEMEGADADIRLAIKFWEDKAGKPLFDYKGLKDPWVLGRPYRRDSSRNQMLRANVIYMEMRWPFGSNKGGDQGRTLVQLKDGRLERGVVVVQPPRAEACRECPWERQTRVSLIAHELGHFLGFGHTQDMDDIMYPGMISIRSLADYTVDKAQLENLTR